MRKACGVLWQRVVLIFALLCLFGPAYAAAPDVPKGLSWLQAQVGADGSLSGEGASLIPTMTPWQTVLLIPAMLALGTLRTRAGREHR